MENTNRNQHTMKTLTALVIAERVFQHVGTKYGLSGANLRVLGAVAALSEGGGRATYKAITTLLHHNNDRALRNSVQVLVAGHYLSKHTGHGAGKGLRLEPEGAKVVAVLEREERVVRLGVATIEVGRWKRKYVRSGKYVGRWAQEQAAREAKATLAQGLA